MLFAMEVMDDPEPFQGELFRGSSLPVSHTRHVVCPFILTHCKPVGSPAFESLLISYNRSIYISSSLFWFLSMRSFTPEVCMEEGVLVKGVDRRYT